MKIVNTVSDALKMIDSHNGPPEEFFLPVSEELLEQQIGFRIYRYKAWD